LVSSDAVTARALLGTFVFRLFVDGRMSSRILILGAGCVVNATFASSMGALTGTGSAAGIGIFLRSDAFGNSLRNGRCFRFPRQRRVSVRQPEHSAYQGTCNRDSAHNAVE
jgi:hypothetical protein